jgi:NAD(P)-dependent dehydrogenase (short-subunit alcohol dehydrogenase family)
MRGMHRALQIHDVPVRVNAVAPSWTGSGLVSTPGLAKLGVYTQPPEAVARAAAVLMADGARRGHLVHVDHGLYKEIDEAVLLPAYESLPHEDTTNEDEAMGMLLDAGVL